MTQDLATLHRDDLRDNISDDIRDDIREDRVISNLFSVTQANVPE